MTEEILNKALILHNKISYFKKTLAKLEQTPAPEIFNMYVREYDNTFDVREQMPLFFEKTRASLIFNLRTLITEKEEEFCKL